MSTTHIVVLIAFVAVVGASVILWRRRRVSAPEDSSTAQTRPGARVEIAEPEEPEAPAIADTAMPVLPHPQEIIAQLYAEAFDSSSVAARTAPRLDHAAVTAGSVRMLSGIENQPKYTPRRPAPLPRLLQKLGDEQSSLQTVSRLIAQDPSLTGNVLRIANSSAYRVSSHPVESIERAVSLIGTEGIRSIVTAALLQPTLGGAGAFNRFAEIIWEHTLYAAAMAEAHAEHIEKDDHFAAQLLALLHGLGSIIVFRVARDQYELHPQLEPDAVVIASLVDSQSAPTARRISKSWDLSPRIEMALEEQDTQLASENLSPLGRSLRFARLAGALVMLTAWKKIEEPEARRILLANDSHTAQIERLWDRLVKTHRPS